MYVYVIHYGEIALKGGNRRYFEKKLIDNINFSVRNISQSKVMRKYGKLLLEDENPKIGELLKKIPGIKYYAYAKKVGLDFDEFAKGALDVINDDFESFRVTCTRGNKLFAMKSPEIERELGAVVLKKYSNKKVKLKNPDLTLFIEVSEKEAYLYIDKIQCVGGLPVGVSGKVVVLFSGGIDSPVASYLMMKRGCEVILMHGFNVRINPEKVREKIYKLAERLSEFQGKLTLVMIPYKKMLVQMVDNVSDKRRMLLFKRSLMRIANKFAGEIGAKAVVNGDSIGQVASQTLDNINVVNSQSVLPVLSPLLGYDKQEIMDLALKIGTYDISNLPYEDCCTVLSGKHPEIKGKIEYAEKFELKIDFENIEKEMMEEAIEKEFFIDFY